MKKAVEKRLTVLYFDKPADYDQQVYEYVYSKDRNAYYYKKVIPSLDEWLKEVTGNPEAGFGLSFWLAGDLNVISIDNAPKIKVLPDAEDVEKHESIYSIIKEYLNSPDECWLFSNALRHVRYVRKICECESTCCGCIECVKKQEHVVVDLDNNSIKVLEKEKHVNRYVKRYLMQHPTIKEIVEYYNTDLGKYIRDSDVKFDAVERMLNSIGAFFVHN